MPLNSRYNQSDFQITVFLRRERPMAGVTAKEIAAKLNLSPSAVSLALNGKPGVSEATRTLVIETAAEAPGPGEAYVRFSSRWVESRPGYVDEDTAPESESGVPLMEDYTLLVGTQPPADHEKE